MQKNEDGSSVANYEIGMALWDTWSVRGPAFSKRHVLQENETIRMSLVIDDTDSEKSERDESIWTFPSPNWWRDAGELSYFELEPKDDNNDAWSVVKHLMN